MLNYRKLRVLTVAKGVKVPLKLPELLIYSCLHFRAERKWTQVRLTRFLGLGRKAVRHGIRQLRQLGLVDGYRVINPKAEWFAPNGYWYYHLPAPESKLSTIQHGVYSLIYSFKTLRYSSSLAVRLGVSARSITRALDKLASLGLVSHTSTGWVALEGHADWWQHKKTAPVSAPVPVPAPVPAKEGVSQSEWLENKYPKLSKRLKKDYLHLGAFKRYDSLYKILKFSVQDWQSCVREVVDNLGESDEAAKLIARFDDIEANNKGIQFFRAKLKQLIASGKAQVPTTSTPLYDPQEHIILEMLAKFNIAEPDTLRYISMHGLDFLQHFCADNPNMPNNKAKALLEVDHD